MSELSSRPPPAGSHAGPVAGPCTTPSGTASVQTLRSGRAPVCSCELDTAFGPAGPILVLRVAGEIDRLTLPVLEHALTAAVDQRPGDLVVDLAAVGFCCVRGFALLVTAAATAQSNGIRFAVSGLSPHLDRVATLLWPQRSEQPCVRYRSAAAAVTAIRTEQTYRPA